MNIRSKIGKSVAIGIVAESLALGASFLLHSLGGREPMEPPYNLVGTILQMPGLIVSNSLSERFGIYSSFWVMTITFIVQAVIWSAISFAIQLLWTEKPQTRPR